MSDEGSEGGNGEGGEGGDGERGDGEGSEGGDDGRGDSEQTESAAGTRLGPDAITPDAPDDFGALQVWWGDGKGKTTAALGMGFRAAGHGFRVHLLQFMKGGAGSVEDVRGEYAAIEAVPGFTYEHAGEYGWHGRRDDSDEADHEAEAQAGLERARTILDGARRAELAEPLSPTGDPESGVHMLVLDELCYAANRDLVEPDAVVDLVESRPEGLELVLTGGHEEPTYVTARADLVTEVVKRVHPFDAGRPARRGTEY